MNGDGTGVKSWYPERYSTGTAAASYYAISVARGEDEVISGEMVERREPPIEHGCMLEGSEKQP
jgi:hypothetical protein